MVPSVMHEDGACRRGGASDAAEPLTSLADPTVRLSLFRILKRSSSTGSPVDESGSKRRPSPGRRSNVSDVDRRRALTCGPRCPGQWVGKSTGSRRPRRASTSALRPATSAAPGLARQRRCVGVSRLWQNATRRPQMPRLRSTSEWPLRGPGWRGGAPPWSRRRARSASGGLRRAYSTPPRRHTSCSGAATRCSHSLCSSSDPVVIARWLGRLSAARPRRSPRPQLPFSPSAVWFLQR